VWDTCFFLLFFSLPFLLCVGKGGLTSKGDIKTHYLPMLGFVCSARYHELKM
jgi:hypothetical protein